LARGGGFLELLRTQSAAVAQSAKWFSKKHAQMSIQSAMAIQLALQTPTADCMP
jgi:hypothetical protein